MTNRRVMMTRVARTEGLFTSNDEYNWAFDNVSMEYESSELGYLLFWWER